MIVCVNENEEIERASNTWSHSANLRKRVAGGYRLSYNAYFPTPFTCASECDCLVHKVFRETIRLK